jgi:diguanylate cyclase
MAANPSWKEKYLQEIEKADVWEKQWQSERNTLERMLVRTSLASEGQTPELDRLLARIRKDLRKKHVDVDAWRELQEQIDRQIALLDDRGEASPTPDSGTAGAASAELDDKSHRLRIARRVGQLIGQLLSQVALEPTAEAEARRLQQALLSSEDWDVLREGLNRVADLVVAAVTRSKREFEAFLRRLDERLEVLRQHFRAQAEVQNGRADETEALDREIRAELQQAQKVLAGTEDIGQLRTSVGQHLEAIARVLDRFCRRESERERILAEQLEAMQEKIAALETHSEQMQEQVNRERLRAMTDLLTQLPNREAWQERLVFEFNRWQRYRHPLTVAVLDIDYFKRVNDSFGHKAGDRVLQLVAREMLERLRSTDFIARYGGEEFVVLLPETSVEDALEVVENLRAHIGRLPFHFSGQPVRVTLSAGLAAFRPGDSETSVFNRADQALYEAKGAGRNQSRTAIA